MKCPKCSQSQSHDSSQHQQLDPYESFVEDSAEIFEQSDIVTLRRELQIKFKVNYLCRECGYAWTDMKDYVIKANDVARLYYNAMNINKFINKF